MRMQKPSLLARVLVASWDAILGGGAYRVHRAADAALAIDDLAALGRPHTGAKAMLAGLLLLRQPMWIMHIPNLAES